MSKVDSWAVSVSRHVGIVPVAIGGCIAIALWAVGAPAPYCAITWQLTLLLGFMVLHGEHVEQTAATQEISATLHAAYPKANPDPATCPHSWASDKEGPVCRICHVRGMISEDGSRHYAVLS